MNDNGTKTSARYSGRKSRKFWKRINAMKGNAAWGVAYTFGVELQNTEARILREIKRLQIESRS